MEERSTSALIRSLQREYDEKDLGRLINFYLACIEEEDLRSLTFPLSHYHRTFLSPWDDVEPLLRPNLPEVQFEVKYKSDRTLLLRNILEAGEPQRFFYGYPIFLDEEDQLSPLFFTEVEIRQIKENLFSLNLINPNEIQFNHHFLRYQHTPIEEIREIQEYLESSQFGSFDARLKAAFEYLGIAEPIWEEKLDPFPNKKSPRNTWYNRPILFRSERNKYTALLRSELEAFKKHPRFLKKTLDTALGSLLSPKTTSSKNTTREFENNELIEIRPLNKSQEIALKSVFMEPLTVITGPPGTGKSQVVLNIIANAVIKGKTVLFASKNNKAVDVVRNWLTEILGRHCDWSFRVGTRQRMEKLKEEMINRLMEISQATSNFIFINDEIKMKLASINQQIANLRKQEDNIRYKLRKLGELINRKREIEALIPEKWVLVTTEDIEIKLDINVMGRLKREIKALNDNKNIGLRLWFLRLIFGPNLLDRYYLKLKKIVKDLPIGILQDIEQLGERDLNWHALLEQIQKLINYLQWFRLYRDVSNIWNEIIYEDNAHLLSAKIKKLKDAKIFLSQNILRDYWTKKIVSNRSEVQLLIKRYFDLSDRLHSEYGEAWRTIRNEFERTCNSLFNYFPVWIVTSLSVKRALPLTPNMFDILIIDEASQCDIASALPLLFRAKRAVIIGDPRQLRHISTLTLNQETKIADITGTTALLPDWSYVRNSIYDVAESAIAYGGRTPFLLCEHFRSHPDIIEFSNRKFYNGALILRTDIPNLTKRLGQLKLGLFWHNVEGDVPYTLHSAYNDAEIKEIVKTLTQWVNEGLLDDPRLTIGVVTPFRLQMERLEEAIESQPWFEKLKGRITVGTAHRFQGDEADVIFFSPVISRGILPRKAEWVANTEQLLNVAITRARGALHIFGDKATCLKVGGVLGAFTEYVLSNETKLHIPFSFQSPAEEKLAELLNSVKLWYHPQYKVGKYRLDFLVISPLGRRYDIEVDGRHHWSSQQFDRDRVRDKFLEKEGYTIIRIDAQHILLHPEKVRSLLERII